MTHEDIERIKQEAAKYAANHGESSEIAFKEGALFAATMYEQKEREIYEMMNGLADIIQHAIRIMKGEE